MTQEEERVKRCLLSALFCQRLLLRRGRPAGSLPTLNQNSARVTGGGGSVPDGGCGEATPSTVARGSRGKLWQDQDGKENDFERKKTSRYKMNIA